MQCEGLQKQAFVQRRSALLAHLGDEAAAVVFNAPERRRNRDTFYPYRASSDFLYLTGFDEPESVLFLLPGRDEGQAVLFLRPKDESREIWDGLRLGVAAAPEGLGVDQAYDIAELDEIAPTLLEGRSVLHFDFGDEPAFDAVVLAWVQKVKMKSRQGIKAPSHFVALGAYLHEARLFKTDQELDLMKKAADISAKAHKQAMRSCKPGLMEFHLEAQLLAGFVSAGARFSAYPSIVGSGANGCILHYIQNNAVLNDGELVLIDAGAELHGYAADITRTFPINGKFSGEQRAVYEVVLQAQLNAIAAVAPGRPVDDYNQAAIKTLTEGLVSLGLLRGEVDALIEDKAYKQFYMHGTGHWLGLDVHDVGQYKIEGKWRQLEERMVLTVEPGLYIAPGTPNVDPRWCGIGIRVEDDVVVQSGKPWVLTEQVPKTIEAIEALMTEG